VGELGVAMSGRRFTSIALFTAALLASSAAFAQGLGDRLTEAEAKLDADIQGCRPINMGDYGSLLNEAGRNKVRADKAKKAGTPIDDALVNADLAKASALWNRAQGALVQQCVRQATQPQTTPQPATTPTPTPATTPAPKTTGALPGGGTGQACATGAATGMRLPEPRFPVPSHAEVNRIGEQLEEAVKNGRSYEAEFLVSELDAQAKNLEKLIRDGTEGGEFSTINVKEAEDRLRNINDWRAWAAKQGVKPCEPIRAPSQAMNLSPFAKEVLAVHNGARAEYGVPALQWSPALEQGAQTYANQLATTGKQGQSVHSSREGRGTARENISQGLPWWSTGQLLGAWTKEKAKFKPGIFPDVSTTFNWYEVGHWTQMIWAQTVMIGCAKAAGIGGMWLVCRYDPGGNKDGKPVGIRPQVIASTGVQQPPLPTREVFNNAPKVVQPVDPDSMGSRASLFDLGIYAGGAWTTDWFNIGETDPRSYDVYEAFSEIRLPLINDYGFGPSLPELPSSTSQIALNHDYGYDAALFVGYDLGAFRIESEVAYKKADRESYNTNITRPGEVDDEFWAGSTGLIANLSEDTRLELGVGYGDYDFHGAPFPGGIYWDPVSQVTVGAGASYVDAINWEPIEDLLFRGSWADGFGQPVHTDSATKEILVDTTVEQPKIPPAEVFNTNAPKVATSNASSNLLKDGKQEPSNPYERCGGSIHFWDAEKAYKEAKAKGNAEGMATAKAQMLDAIERQYQAADAAGSVGEFASMSTYSLGDFLGKMMDSYWDTTGEIPPKYYEPPSGFTLDESIVQPIDTAVEQPELPPREVFGPEAPKTGCGEVM
jgi:hypothetical protein